MKYPSLLFGIGLCLISALLVGWQQADTPAKTLIISSAPAPTTDDCASARGLTQVICLADAFKATLTGPQVAALQLPYSKTDAANWSNLPQGLGPTRRVGINLGSLNATQRGAAKALLAAVLVPGVPNEGYEEMEGILAADDFLAANGGGPVYGAGNFYLAFLGTPSTTGLWELQFGGHHYAVANTYNGGKITGVTPSFRAVEPMAPITANGQTYQPIEQERQTFATMLAGLSRSEQATASLSATFRDVLLGPHRDGQFPTTKQGLKVGTLDAPKKALVLSAIRRYVDDLDPATAAAVLLKYSGELADTYIAYSGTLTMGEENDYVRIDGPSVWIEYSMQHGIIIRGTPHPHSVWRDRTGDYGGH